MPETSGRRRLLLNSTSSTVLHVVRIVTAFVMSPIIVGALGDRMYGIWEVLLALVGYFGILDLGLGPAIVRYVAVESRGEDRQSLARIISSSLTVMVVVGIVAAGLMLLASTSPELVLDVELDRESRVPLALVLIGVTLALRFPGAVLDAYYFGLQRHYLINGLRLVNMVVSAGATWYLLTRTDLSGLLVVAGVQFIGTAAHHLVVAVHFLRDPGRTPVRASLVSMATLHELYGFGLKSMLLMVSDRLRTASMPLVITHVLSIDLVVFYALADKVVNYGQQLGQVLGFPLHSYFSSLAGDPDRSSMRREWLDMSRYLQFVQFGLGAGVVVLGADFLSRWMGPEYGARARWLIPLLGAAMIARSVPVNSSRLLVSLARHERAVMVTMPANLGGVILAIVLAATIGLDGVALAILVSMVVAAWLMLRESCRAIEVPIGRYLRQTTLPNLVPLAWLFLLLLAAKRVLPEMGYPEIALAAAVGGIGFLAVGWWLVLKPAERRQLADLVASSLRSRS